MVLMLCADYDDTEGKEENLAGYIILKVSGSLGNYAANNPRTRANALRLLGQFAA